MKSIYKNIKLIALTGLLAFGISCTDDLNITPEDDQTVLSNNLFNNENAYEQVLAGVYANFSLTGTDGAGSSNIQGLDAGTSQYGRVLLYLQSFASDEMVWSYENDPGIRDIQRNTWGASNPLVLGMFERANASVIFANNFLRETTDAKLNERNVSADTKEKIKTYRAEARLVRALAYYHLMDMFGKAPFATEDTPINVKPSQANRTELFDFIEAELKAIDADLLDPANRISGRADKAVAWMILAKMYLNAEVYVQQNKYADCISYCEKIINSGVYSLAQNYLENFMADNDTNEAKNEIIFSFLSDGITTQNYGPTTIMINGEVGSIEKNGLSLGVSEGGWGGAIRIRKQLADLFEGGSFASDTRNTMLTADRSPVITSIADKDQGYVITKYKNITSTGADGSDKTFADIDFPLFRYADVLLMYTEAVVRGGGGDMSLAVDYFNSLRTRAKNPELITSGDLTLNVILNERGREFYAEGHRRQDLIRFNQYTGGNYNWAWKGNGSNGIAIPTTMNVYPIPSSSIAANPNLTQNAGY